LSLASLWQFFRSLVERKIMSQERELTFGERAVGLTFNPSGNDDVDAIKKAFANTIDILNDLRSATPDPEIKRMLSIAVTDAQSAQMWAVKAVTWRG
jgi:hypothetical protein